MTGTRYVFDKWTLDCARGILICDNGIISLRPKSFEVLLYLVRNAGQLVSREDVLRAVWPGVTVTEESLTQCISEVRHVLGDSAQNLIKTLPKRGYLFAASTAIVESRPTIPLEEPTSTEGNPAPAQKSIPVPASRPVLEGPSVAVLPFVNMSGNAGQDYLSDGITEDVIGGLSRFSGLSVIARASSFSYKGRTVDVRDVGNQLGVRYLVEGSVRRFDDRIRITACLVDAHSGAQRWSERFDRPLGDVFAVQDEITQSIVAIVFAYMTKAEIERVSRKPAGSWTAYDLTLQGDRALTLSEQLWDAQYLYEARRHYTEASLIEPDNAKIRARLGHTYVRAYADPTSPDMGDRRNLEQGHALARLAVGLDPNLPLARAQLGWAYAWMREPDAAIAEFEKATTLNANFVDYRFSLILTFAGEPERALRVAADYARLDPFYGSMLPVIRGIALFLLERYAEALAAMRECRGRAPHVPGQAVLAATLVRLGEAAEARAVIAELLTRLPHLSRERWPMSSVFRRPGDSDRLFDALGVASFP